MTTSTSDCVTCARAFKVRVIPGQEAAYGGYLREVVEPIDAIAHAAGVFAHMYAVRPEDPGTDWPHARVFPFTDEAQRQRFTETTAQACGVEGGQASERLCEASTFAPSCR